MSASPALRGGPTSSALPPAGPGPRFVVSVDELAALVSHDQVVSSGGFNFTRLPIRLLEAVARRGTRGLTYVQWGGGLALEILLEAEAVSRIVYCFSNLDIFGLAPGFRRVLESGSVESDEYTALEMHHALLARAMNLPTLPLQAPLGSWRMEQRRADSADLVMAPDIPVGSLLLHAQRADTSGNIEIDGSQGLDRTLAFAGARVLATVEEIVPAGRLQARAAVIPRQFVEAIALVPGGAWPTSCMPFYAPDYRELARRVGAGRFASDGEPAEPPAACRRIAALRWQGRAWPSGQRMPGTEVADQMVAWLSRRLDNTSVCSVGAVSPLATVAYLTAKATHAPGLTLVTHNGGYVDVAARFMSLSIAEAADYQSAALYCGGDDSYRWFYQQGRVTHEIVSAAQIDRSGRTNNRWIRRSDGSRLRLPGQGGMADVANMHRNFILYVTRQSPRQLVEHIDGASAARVLVGSLERARHGYAPGEMALITNLGTYTLDEASGVLQLTTLHPGVSFDEVVEATGFALEEQQSIPVTVPPTSDELEAIARVDPFGVRRLEFVPSRERASTIQELLEREDAYLRGFA